MAITFIAGPAMTLNLPTSNWFKVVCAKRGRIQPQAARASAVGARSSQMFSTLLIVVSVKIREIRSVQFLRDSLNAVYGGCYLVNNETYLRLGFPLKTWE